jgi:flagellar hook-associated protein FlgK
MKDRKEELVILQKQLADIELERSSKIQTLSSLEEKIASQNTQLIHNIERAEKQMQDLYEQKARALAAISQQIEIKQKMVIELDKHLKEKIAELDTVPTSYV